MIKIGKYLKDSKGHLFKIIEVNDHSVLIESLLTGTTKQIEKNTLISKIDSGKMKIGTDFEVYDENNNN